MHTHGSGYILPIDSRWISVGLSNPASFNPFRVSLLRGNSLDRTVKY